ncbi:tonsoku-like protein [Toxorhynchites rutilus septentrionalis]|uniref:tonsoku-like protein n=1 Tax=Toxorhynchites rutilus septentrionalis TaxID=329112 RepID=UPI002479016C|nr:tonsoku-like protein [Toxorhynchites rutilus septentrionalis]
MNMNLEEQKLLRRKTKSSDAQNFQQLADTCSKLGEMYSDRGEHRKALNEYKLVASAYKKMNMQMEYGRANRLVGEMFMLLAEFDTALRYEKIYLEMATKEGDKVELQRAHVTIGRTYLLQGQNLDGTEAAKVPLGEAEKAFLKSLRLSRVLKGVGKLEQFDMEARSLLNLGVTKEHQGYLEEAIDYMQKAMKIAKNNDLLELLHQCYHSSALLFNIKQNNYARALKMLNEALEVASRLHNKSSKMCETLLIKSDVLIRMGDFQSAKQALRKAYKLKTPVVSDAENVEHQLRAVIALCRVEDELITVDSTDYGKKKLLYERMGDGACKLENFGKAIDFYLKMLECAQLNEDNDRQLVPIYVSLYQTYKDNKQYEEALVYLWKEYDIIKDIPKEAFNTLAGIAEVYEEQNKSCFEIEDIYRRAREEAKKIRSLKLERLAIKRCIEVLKKNEMDLMVEKLEKDAKDSGIDLALEDDDDDDDANNDSEDEQNATETSIEFHINSPDIGEDVNLSDLTDSDEEITKATEKTVESRSIRKRGTSFQIRRNNKGETQLHQACISGNKLLVQKLLEQGHPVNIRDHAGWLPLHEACIHGHKEIVEMLLDRGAHINDKGGTSCDGITPLYDACCNGNLEIVELLLDRGANCTQRTDSGDTTANILEVWFKGVRGKLEDADIVYYNTIRDRIVACFEKVGINPNNPQSIEPEVITETTRSTRRRVNRAGGSDSSSEKAETSTICTVTSNRSSGYGSIKDVSQNSARRKRLPSMCSDSSGLSSDSESDPDEFNRSSLQGKHSHNASGVDDYRNAMQILRKGTTVRAQIVSPLKDPNPGPAKRAAHMGQQEVGDDWLDDDLGPKKKRQKFTSEKDYAEPNKINRTASRRSFEPEPTSPQKSSCFPIQAIVSNALDYDSDEIPLAEENELASAGDSASDAHRILMNASGRSFHRRPTGHKRASRSNSSASLRNQTSLLEAGFNMSSRSDSPTIGLMEENLLSPTKSNSGQRTPRKCGAELGKNTPTKVLPPNMVRVIVDGDPIDICYDEGRMLELNVGWLINEVVKRYGIKHGKRPLIKLLRTDGGLCVDSDPLTTFLGGNDPIITSYVIEYERLRADQFYEDYSKHRDVELLTDMFQALVTLENTDQLLLRREFFSGKPRQWDVLFQALAYQGRVKVLDLSFNQLADSEFQPFIEKLPSLKYLEKLSLSMNHISHIGMYNLSTLIVANPDHGTSSLSALTHLTELDLSQNPLLDQSLLVLTRVCQHLMQLKVLRLTATEITNLTFATPPMDIARLQVFDVSENRLNKKSIDYMFSKLNTKILTEFNLNALGKLRDFKPALTASIQSCDFDMLRSLNLSNCDLTDADLSAIIFSLKTSAEKLKHLDVSFNAKLTLKSLVDVFQSFTDRSLECVRFVQNFLVLKQLGDNLIEMIRYEPDNCYPHRVELMQPLRLTEQELEKLRWKVSDFWKRIWSSRAVVEFQGMNVSLFVQH